MIIQCTWYECTLPKPPLSVTVPPIFGDSFVREMLPTTHTATNLRRTCFPALAAVTCAYHLSGSLGIRHIHPSSGRVFVIASRTDLRESWLMCLGIGCRRRQDRSQKDKLKYK